MAYSVAAEYATVLEVNDFMGFGCGKEEYDLAADSGASQGANADKIYVGADKVPLFSAGMKLRVWDASNQVGEERVVTAVGSNYVQFATALTGDYETSDYAKWKMLHKFTNRSNPTWAWVENEIKKAQDDLDRRMRKSFLVHGRRYKEWADFNPRWRQRYPESRVYPFYPSDVFWKIQLERYPIKEFSADENDHIYLYDGSDVIDLLDGNHTEWKPETGGSRTDADFWVDYEKGIIYLFKTRPRYGLKSAQIIYRHSEYDFYYGDDSGGNPTNRVPSDVNEATLMWVGLRLLWMDRYAGNTPSGEDGIVDVRMQAREWKEEIERIVDNHRSVPFFGRGK